jgi:predicted phage-related endonuclease
MKGEHTMTERQLKNRIEKLDAIAAQQKALEEQAEAIRNEIKADMEEKGVDEISAFGRIARWKENISSRLDSKALKAALPDVYGQYSKQTVSKRFTVA